MTTAHLNFIPGVFHDIDLAPRCAINPTSAERELMTAWEKAKFTLITKEYDTIEDRFRYQYAYDCYANRSQKDGWIWVNSSGTKFLVLNKRVCAFCIELDAEGVYNNRLMPQPTGDINFGLGES